MYVIQSNDDTYVQQLESGFTITKSPNLATVWKKESSAENVVKNCLKNHFQNFKNFRVMKLEDIIPKKVETELPEINKEELFSNLISALQIASTLVSQIKQYSKVFEKDERQQDLLTQDILHAMEFYNYNACKGYQIYKELQNVRKTRRINKDLHQLADLLEKTFDEQKILEHLQQLESRTYHPRVEDSLFTD